MRCKNEKKRIIELIRHWIRENHPDLLAVYGFGSFFTDQIHRQSDIDLAVLFKKKLTHQERWEIQESLARILLYNVDLLDLRQVSPVMGTQVFSTGEQIYCTQENEVHAFETYIFSTYAKLNEERRAILEDVLKRGTIHG